VRKKTCYIICEDNNDYRESVVAFLDEDEELVCCGSFANADNIIEAVTQYKPEVVLMDIDMPGKNGIEALKEIKELFFIVKIFYIYFF